MPDYLFNPHPQPVIEVSESGEPKAIRLVGAAASYDTHMIFNFPSKIADYVSEEADGFKTIWMGDYTWELIPNAGSARIRLGYETKRRYELQTSSPDTPRFGSTRCEFLIKGDGSIFCRLLERPKPYVKQPRKNPYTRREKPPEQETATGLKLRMWKVLEEISRIEEESLYQLFKLDDGSYEWLAPRVSR